MKNLMLVYILFSFSSIDLSAQTMYEDTIISMDIDYFFDKNGPIYEDVIIVKLKNNSNKDIYFPYYWRNMKIYKDSTIYIIERIETCDSFIFHSYKKEYNKVDTSFFWITNYGAMVTETNTLLVPLKFITISPKSSNLLKFYIKQNDSYKIPSSFVYKNRFV